MDDKEICTLSKKIKHTGFPLYSNSKDMDIFTLHKVNYTSSDSLFISLEMKIDLSTYVPVSLFTEDDSPANRVSVALRGPLPGVQPILLSEV